MKLKKLRSKGFRYCEYLIGKDVLIKSLPIYSYGEIGDYVFTRIELWPRPESLGPMYVKLNIDLTTPPVAIKWKRVWVNKLTGQIESYESGTSGG